MDSEPANVIKQSKTPAYTLRAIKKYQEKNRDKINAKRRESYRLKKQKLLESLHDGA
jgi:hypothetical protein